MKKTITNRNQPVRENHKCVSVLIKPGRRLVCCLLFFYITACNNNSGYQTYVPSKIDSLRLQMIVAHARSRIAILSKQIKTGDIITRTGSDFTSECLRQINLRDKRWSHCGIASIEHDSVFVYHALGGDFNPDEKIKRDYLPIFADPENNRGTGIYRQQLSLKEVDQLIALTKKLYHSDTRFDMDFDLQTDDRMYCAEFVYKTFLWSTGGRIHFNNSKIKSKVFVGIDDIILYPHCQEIEKLFYQSDAIKN